jgi:hypothetical protein
MVLSLTGKRIDKAKELWRERGREAFLILLSLSF